MIVVVDWLKGSLGWSERDTARPRDLIRFPRLPVVKGEGRHLPLGFLSRMTTRRSGRLATQATPPTHHALSRPDSPDGVEDPERDRALMRLVCEHNESALTALYDRYAAMVNGLALSILRNPSLAEEVTHDVFLRVWQQPTAYDPARGSFAGWLMRVARNRAIDLLRKRREDPLGAVEVDSASWIADPAPGPEEQAITGLHRQEVRSALDDLAPDQRQLLELAYFTGLSQSQIAEHLQRPLGTVKSQIRSAMRTMAERLASSDHQAGTQASRTMPSSGEGS